MTQKLPPELFRPELQGCTDVYCLIQDNSKRMHTNGGCQCQRELSRTVEGRNAVKTIKWLRRRELTKKLPPELK